MFIVSAVSIVILDQLSKYVARGIGVTVQNPGVSFAWFDQTPPIILLVLLGVICVGVAYVSRPFWKRYPLWAGLFWGGLLSNLLDRLLFGGVTDWFTIPLTDLKNNLADGAIGIGAAMMAVQMLKEKNHV